MGLIKQGRNMDIKIEVRINYTVTNIISAFGNEINTNGLGIHAKRLFYFEPFLQVSFTSTCTTERIVSRCLRPPGDESPTSRLVPWAGTSRDSCWRCLLDSGTAIFG